MSDNNKTPYELRWEILKEMISITKDEWYTKKELAQYNITCNSFAPGVVDTPLWKPLNQDLFDMGAAQAPDSAINEFSVGILKGRPAKPEDLVGMAMFLASSESDYFTGQTIMIDGGMVLV